MYFLLITFLTTLKISMFEVTFSGLLIRYDNLELYYEYHYERTTEPRQTDFILQDELDTTTRKHKSSLCSKVLDSIFFKNRQERLSKPKSKIDFFEDLKYYKKFVKTYFKEITTEKKNFFLSTQMKEELITQPYTLIDVHVGHRKYKEKVFSCLIHNLRSNTLNQIWISRYYHGMVFVLKRDQNRKLKVLALVEQSAKENKKIPNASEESISLSVSRNFRNFPEDYLLRLCNLAINSPGEHDKKYIFLPQKYYVVDEIVSVNLKGLKKSFRTHKLPPVDVVTCVAFENLTGKKTKIFISNVFHYELCWRSVYVFEKKRNEMELFRYITNLKISNEDVSDENDSDW